MNPAKRNRIVLVGATSAMAEHCARRWVQEAPADLVLVGRDLARLERAAADLRVRSPESTVTTLVAGFIEPAAIAAAVDGIWRAGPVDIALIAHGSLPDQAACQDSLEAGSQALAINGLAPCLFAEAFARPMSRAGTGTVAILSSVAGDRGRRSNYVYGAAKGMVTRYAQGLQHRFAGSGVRIVLIKPGPTDTPMTAHLKADGAKLAPVDKVAGDIVGAIRAGRPLVYTPGIWRVIMMVIRHLPQFIFNKLNI